jgi:tRNA threonylcarbamoyladenosine biosynthesis protein TsaB
VLVLAFDTATAAVTVALSDWAPGHPPRLRAESKIVDRRRHAEVLAPAINTVLGEAQVSRSELSAIAVGVGPGPYTGLRVGLVTARTLGAVLGIPVLGVCTLDVLALGSGLDGEFRVVTDARRREVHWAAYRAGPAGPERLDGPYVGAPALCAHAGPSVGAGASLYPDSFPDRRPPQHPRAADLARWVAAGLPTTGPDPLYLRRPDAAEPGARKSVLARPQP